MGTGGHTKTMHATTDLRTDMNTPRSLETRSQGVIIAFVALDFDHPELGGAATRVRALLGLLRRLFAGGEGLRPASHSRDIAHDP